MPAEIPALSSAKSYEPGQEYEAAVVALKLGRVPQPSRADVKYRAEQATALAAEKLHAATLAIQSEQKAK